MSNINNNNNPFADSFPDPICKLNLKETSEFVKSLPVLDVSSQQQQHRRLESPSTPGRPLFTFSSSVAKNLSRKNFPSKWDDAEKWLISTSCHDSPAHNITTTTTKQCDIFKQKKLEDFSHKSRVMEERVSMSKAAPNFQKSPSLDHNNSVGIFNGIPIPCPTDVVLKGAFTFLTPKYDLSFLF